MANNTFLKKERLDVGFVGPISDQALQSSFGNSKVDAREAMV